MLMMCRLRPDLGRLVRGGMRPTFSIDHGEITRPSVMICVYNSPSYVKDGEKCEVLSSCFDPVGNTRMLAQCNNVCSNSRTYWKDASDTEPRIAPKQIGSREMNVVEV